MPDKRQILSVLSRTILLEIARSFELTGLSAKPKDSIFDALMSSKNQIAMWMLDTDYGNRSLFPSQVFFPLAGQNEGWATLAKNLRAEIDEEKTEAFRGRVLCHLSLGKESRLQLKLWTTGGIESLKIIRL